MGREIAERAVFAVAGGRMLRMTVGLARAAQRTTALLPAIDSNCPARMSGENDVKERQLIQQKRKRDSSPTCLPQTLS